VASSRGTSRRRSRSSPTASRAPRRNVPKASSSAAERTRRPRRRRPVLRKAGHHAPPVSRPRRGSPRSRPSRRSESCRRCPEAASRRHRRAGPPPRPVSSVNNFPARTASAPFARRGVWRRRPQHDRARRATVPCRGRGRPRPGERSSPAIPSGRSSRTRRGSGEVPGTWMRGQDLLRRSAFSPGNVDHAGVKNPSRERCASPSARRSIAALKATRATPRTRRAPRRTVSFAKIAWYSFSPSCANALRPPFLRQGNRSFRKYQQRGRCRRFPPAVATCGSAGVAAVRRRGRREPVALADDFLLGEAASVTSGADGEARVVVAKPRRAPRR